MKQRALPLAALAMIAAALTSTIAVWTWMKEIDELTLTDLETDE